MGTAWKLMLCLRHMPCLSFLCFLEGASSTPPASSTTTCSAGQPQPIQPQPSQPKPSRQPTKPSCGPCAQPTSCPCLPCAWPSCFIPT